METYSKPKLSCYDPQYSPYTSSSALRSPITRPTMNSNNQKNKPTKSPKDIQWPSQRPRTNENRAAKPIELAARSSSKAQTTASSKENQAKALEPLRKASEEPRHWYNRWPFNSKAIDQDIERFNQSMRDERRLLEQIAAEVHTHSLQPQSTSSLTLQYSEQPSSRTRN